MEDHAEQVGDTTATNLPKYINGRPAEAGPPSQVPERELLTAGPYILPEATPEWFFAWLQDATQHGNNAVLGKDSYAAFWSFEWRVGPPSREPLVRMFYDVSLGERDRVSGNAMSPNIHFAVLDLAGGQIEVTGSCSFPIPPFADFFHYIVARLEKHHAHIMQGSVEAEALVLPERLSRRTGGRPRATSAEVEAYRPLLVELTRHGLSDLAIAHRFGLSRVRIQQLRKKWGIPATRHPGGKLVVTKPK